MTSTGYYDEDLNLMKAIFPMGGGTLEMIACSKETAMGENDNSDISKEFEIKSPVNLSGPIKGKAVEYHIRPKNGDNQLDLPTLLGQTVRPAPANGIYLTVRRQKIPWNTKFTPHKDKEVLRALKSTSYLQKNDIKIDQLTKETVFAIQSPTVAARNIKAFVHQYIKLKDYSVGYATAAEVAKNRQGDCTEHALLTAAMCRNAGIPARVVFGVVYVNKDKKETGQFVYHAWNEVYLGEKWYGLDSTYINKGYGPGHIGLFSGDGNPASMAPHIMGYLGNLIVQGARGIE